MGVCQAHFCAMGVKYCTRHGYQISPRWVELSNSNYHLPDLAAVLASVTHALELIGRVRNGQCPEGTSLWDSQGCNPVADAHSVPHDSVIVLFLVPILILTYFKGCTIQAAAVGSVIGLVGTSVALWMTGGYLQLYTALYGGIFALVTFEAERTKRVSFLLTRSVRIKQESLHKEQLAAVTSMNKAMLVEAEMKQLRALMGNVAHDLKTPIACIAADIALMRDAAWSEGPGNPNPDLNLNPYPDGGNNHTNSRTNSSANSSSKNSPNSSSTNRENSAFATFANSIEATANFMLMAINRSQDFVKSSLNMALSPTISAFSVLDALTFACTCVDHTQTGREIVLHPLPQGMCPYVMTDRQWFIENVMCLVDNATKYRYVTRLQCELSS
jgi:signal transduction histidine kinase